MSLEHTYICTVRLDHIKLYNGKDRTMAGAYDKRNNKTVISSEHCSSNCTNLVHVIKVCVSCNFYS